MGGSGDDAPDEGGALLGGDEGVGVGGGYGFARVEDGFEEGASGEAPGEAVERWSVGFADSGEEVAVRAGGGLEGLPAGGEIAVGEVVGGGYGLVQVPVPAGAFGEDAWGRGACWSWSERLLHGGRKGVFEVVGEAADGVGILGGRRGLVNGLSQPMGEGDHLAQVPMFRSDLRGEEGEVEAEGVGRAFGQGEEGGGVAGVVGEEGGVGAEVPRPPGVEDLQGFVEEAGRVELGEGAAEFEVVEVAFGRVGVVELGEDEVEEFGGGAGVTWEERKKARR